MHPVSPGTPHPHPLPTQGEGRLPVLPKRTIHPLAPPSPRVGEGWGGGAPTPDDRAAR
jgi:hypothetical protein